MTYRLLPEAAEAVSTSLFLTGSMRTGTTVMAQLLASTRDTELFFEPPSLYALVPLVKSMPREVWAFLITSILYEDLLIPHLAGRNLNLNPHDLSNAARFIADNEISYRHSKAFGHSDLVEASRRYRIGFKIPEMMPYVSDMRHSFPRMTAVTMVRSPLSVIHSMVNKGWYRQESVVGASKKWPLKTDETANFPFWLPDELHEQWVSMTEPDRCCLAYIHQYRNSAPGDFDQIIAYDDFVRRPEEIFSALLEALELEAGALTNKILSSVVDRSESQNSTEIGIDPAMKGEALALYQHWRNALTVG